MEETVDSLDTAIVKAFFAIVEGEVLVWDAVQDALQDAGVPVGVARLIPLMYLTDSPMRLQKLTERTCAKESAMSRLVERMVEDGLIAKRRDKSDGRAVMLVITPEGRRVEAAGRAVFTKRLRELFDDLDEDELRALRSLIARVGAPREAVGA